MAYTSADLDALDNAIKGGELEVEMDGRRIKYQSVSQLIRLRNQIIQNMSSTTTSSVRAVRARVGKCL